MNVSFSRMTPSGDPQVAGVPVWGDHLLDLTDLAAVGADDGVADLGDWALAEIAARNSSTSITALATRG
jgi:hypothetical protein